MGGLLEVIVWDGKGVLVVVDFLLLLDAILELLLFLFIY